MKKLLLLIFLLIPLHAFAQDCTKGQTVTFAQLPTVKYPGTACTVTDATVCTIGSPVAVGGGSTTCQVAWFTPNWVAELSTPSGASGGGANLAAPGPIGGTTPSTGQFTSLGVGMAPDGTNAHIRLPMGGTNFNFEIMSTGGFWALGLDSGTSILWGGWDGLSVRTGSNTTLSIHGDSDVSSMARMPLRFDEGREAALAPNESMGTFATAKAMTIENIVLDIKVSPTCTVSEQIACYDCGNAGGACTAGQVSTIMNPVTIATGATRQSIIEPINQSSVGASEFISCLIIAGTCTVSDNSISMMARPQ